MKRSDFFLILFVLVSAMELIGVAMGAELIQFIVKPMIILTLVGHYLAKTPLRDNRFLRALFFCWAGDVLLMFQSEGEGFFMAGLVAFLLGHILYIMSYNRFRWDETGQELLITQKIRYSLPVVLAGTGLLTILFPALGPLRIPVIVYALVLMLMVMAAIFRYGRTSSSSFWLIFSGACFFMLSDSLLAINKFYAPFPQSGLAVMSTYILAQYLIVEGVLRHTPGRSVVNP